MNQPSNMTVQQWIEFIRHAKDDEEIAALATGFDQAFEAATLDDVARVDVLLTAGEVLYEKARYKDAQRLLARGAEQARKIQSKGKQALALGLLADLERVTERLNLETGIQDGHFIHGQILSHLLQEFGLTGRF